MHDFILDSWVGGEIKDSSAAHRSIAIGWFYRVESYFNLNLFLSTTIYQFYRLKLDSIINPVISAAHRWLRSIGGHYALF